jgi:hypothetical protein
MAHFAQLDEYNNVIKVHVIADTDILDENGNENEEVGIRFCKSLYGENTFWKQTSYNGNFRVRYSGIGMIYNEEHDAFIYPQRYSSWTFNPQTCDWDPPVLPPELTEEQVNLGFIRIWIEDRQEWIIENRNFSV